MIVGKVMDLAAQNDDRRRVRGLSVSESEFMEALKLYRKMTGCTCLKDGTIRGAYYLHDQIAFGVVLEDPTCEPLPDGNILYFRGCNCRRHPPRVDVDTSDPIIIKV
jgi:hypothetical protein